MKLLKQNVLFYQMITILIENEWISVQKVAQALNISGSTIRRKLDDLNDTLEKQQLGCIEKSPRLGIRLSCKDKRIVLDHFEHYDLDNLMNGETQIYRYLILILSKTNDRFTLQELSEQVYDSLPACKKKIDIVSQWLTLFGIDLHIRKNYGIYLNGLEANIRLAIKHIVIHNPLYGVEDSIKLFAKGIDLVLLKKCITEIEKEWNFKFSEESFHSMLLYAALAITRSSFSCITLSDSEKEIVVKYNEYNWSSSLFKQIEESFLVDIEEEEIQYFAIQLLCSKMIGTSELEEGGAYQYDEKLKEFVSRIISVISNIMNVDLTCDSELYYGLLNHLRPAIFRMKFEKHSTQDLTAFIQEKFQQTYRVSWALSILFEEYYGIRISSTELSYITLYIQTSLDRLAVPLKIVLVTELGMGLNQMFCNKIKLAIPKVEKISVVSLHDFKYSEFEEYDLIVTTSNLKGVDKRIVQISSLLSEEGINQIKGKIEVMKSHRMKQQRRFDVSCHNLFDPNLIFTRFQVTNKNELLQMMADRLFQMGHVKKKYLSTILEREKTVSTYIGNGVAIPHGFSNFVNESKIVVITLDQPLLWDDENEVQFVFLLALRIETEEDSRVVQLFYKGFLEFIDTDEDLQYILGLDKNELYKNLLR